MPNINSMAAIKICSNISVAIETAIFYQNGESIQVNFKKKFFYFYKKRIKITKINSKHYY